MGNIKKHNAFYGEFDIHNLLDEVLDREDHDLLNEDEENNGPSNYGMLNPDLLNLNFDEQDDPSQPSTTSIASSFTENESLPPTVSFGRCSLLNKEQQKLFNFIIRHSKEF